MPTRKQKYIIFDVETYSDEGKDAALDINKAIIFSYCVGFPDGKVIVKRVDGEPAVAQKNREYLQELLNDTSIIKVAHHYHYELGVLTNKYNKYIVPENTTWDDTMLMSQMLRNLAPSHRLDALCWELAGYDKTIDADIKQLARQYGNYKNIPERKMHAYQIADGERTYLLYNFFKPMLVKNAAQYDDYLQEVLYVKNTIPMERAGMLLDVKATENLIKELDKKIATLEGKFAVEFGHYVNVNSAKKLIPFLYKELGYPVLKLSKTGNPSMDKEALAALIEMYPMDKVFDYILEIRSYSTAKSYAKSYLDLRSKRNIIHCHVNTNKARTGRQSVSRPNMQNVSKDGSARVKYPVSLRSCFRARPGKLLYLVDYAGIEMRLIIDRAGEQRWIDLLLNGGDPHNEAAEFFYGDLFLKEQDKARKKKLRGAAKNASFAIPYGAGAGKIVNMLSNELSEQQAHTAYDRYCKAVPKIANFTKTNMEQIKTLGYVETPFGRKLYVDGRKAYAGSNYLIQGTAAGILKRGINNIVHWLQTDGKEYAPYISLLITIHDELILEVDRKILKHEKIYLQNMTRCLTDIEGIKVPLDVEWKRTPLYWNEAEEIKKCNGMTH